MLSDCSSSQLETLPQAQNQGLSSQGYLLSCSNARGGTRALPASLFRDVMGGKGGGEGACRPAPCVTWPICCVYCLWTNCPYVFLLYSSAWGVKVFAGEGGGGSDVGGCQRCEVLNLGGWLGGQEMRGLGLVGGGGASGEAACSMRRFDVCSLFVRGGRERQRGGGGGGPSLGRMALIPVSILVMVRVEA